MTRRARLAAVAERGVHDPEHSPFSSGWTDHPAQEFGHRFAQYFWNRCAAWNPASWALPFRVYLAGEPVGVQQITADNFPLLGHFLDTKVTGSDDCYSIRIVWPMRRGSDWRIGA